MILKELVAKRAAENPKEQLIFMNEILMDIFLEREYDTQHRIIETTAVVGGVADE